MAYNSTRPLFKTALLLGTPLFLAACSFTGGITPQEAAVKDQVAVDQYMPATREMRDNIETQELFAQAAFWSHEYELNPTDLEATLKLAATVRKLGNPGRSVEITQTSRTMHPRDPYLLAEHAAGLIADNRALDAIPVLDQGLRVTQGYGRLWSLKGAALDQIEEYDAARQNYARALQITPNDPNVLTNLGLSYALSGDLRAAETWLRRASTMPGSGGSARENLAMVLQLQGRTEEADRELRLAGMSRGQQKFPAAPVPALSPRGTPASFTERGIPAQSVPTQGYQTQGFPTQAQRAQGNYSAPSQNPGYAQNSGFAQNSGYPQTQPTAANPGSYNAQMGGMPPTRLMTTSPNGQSFTSSKEAARQTAQARGQYATQSAAPVNNTPLATGPMSAEQQSVLNTIRQSLQPGAVTPQGQQPYVVGPSVQTQQPQAYGQQTGTGANGQQPYAYPQQTIPAGSYSEQGREPARRRR